MNRSLQKIEEILFELIEFLSADLPCLKDRIENKDYRLFFRKELTGLLADQILLADQTLLDKNS